MIRWFQITAGKNGLSSTPNTIGTGEQFTLELIVQREHPCTPSVKPYKK